MGSPSSVLWPPANVRPAPDKHPLEAPESSRPLSHGPRLGLGVLKQRWLQCCLTALRHPSDSRGNRGEPSPPPTQGQPPPSANICERFKAVLTCQGRVGMGEF